LEVDKMTSLQKYVEKVWIKFLLWRYL
jgi:hypothetical protein